MALCRLSSIQTEKVQGDTLSKEGESAKVTGARLVSARKRQRKIASRSRVRFGDEEPSVVGTLESPVADSECPLRSGPVWRWKDSDSGENMLEWAVDDFGEKITEEVDEANASNRPELGVVFTCVNPARKDQERRTTQGQGHRTATTL